jgi:adenylate kinase family enzyme
MRAGWFICDGKKITQSMIFPLDHPDFPDQAKGIKQVLTERNLWDDKLTMQCKKCPDDSETCCAKRILNRQPDFMEQASLVQEVIEEAGHLCIVLPKFHCELNPIEFFWGATKRYLCENCDYTFATLQENMPKALKSVDVHTIRKWEHRMFRWMDAYRDNLSAKDAQLKVKLFSSRQYTSHRRVPESLARVFDA